MGCKPFLGQRRLFWRHSVSCAEPVKDQRQRRVWTDREKAQALVVLDLCNGDVTDAANKLGIARQSLEQWRDNKGVNSDVQELRRIGKTYLADMWEAIAEKALGKIPEKLEHSSAAQLATIAAIAVDKMLLLRGQATEITEHRMPQEEALNRLSALVEQARNAGLQSGAQGAGEGEITTIEGESR